MSRNLPEILTAHALWRTDPTMGAYASLSGADLFRANLVYADLYDADLSGANLVYADLSGANLSGADLSGADLSGANLFRANLSRANLGGANLAHANLSGADLSGADLSGADLSGANVDAVRGLFQLPPEIGAFLVFKKLEGEAVAVLRIPEDAPRVGGWTGRKCRAAYADVLEILGAGGKSQLQGKAKYDGTHYVVGETVVADKYDPNPRVECSGGIHFFMTRAEAEAY